jgi:membrane protease YdiL (CAAX protease family)
LAGREELKMAQTAPHQHAEAPTDGSLRFIKQHPILAFYVLAFSISWAGILLLVGGPVGMPGTSEQVDRLFLVVMLAWFAGPSLASLAMTGLVDGRAGLRDLLARSLRWQVGARWLVMALLTAPLVDAATSFALSLASPEYLPNILKTTDKPGLLLMAIAYGLIGGGLLEELGWTGFATPRLRERHGLLGTGIIVGVLWGAYHFSVIFWATGPAGALPLVLLGVRLFAWMPAYRVLMVWVYDHTASLLVAMLMHASLTASMFIFQPMTIADPQLLTYLLLFAAVLWALVAVVVVVNGPQPARWALRPRVAR